MCPLTFPSGCYPRRCFFHYLAISRALVSRFRSKPCSRPCSGGIRQRQPGTRDGNLQRCLSHWRRCDAPCVRRYRRLHGWKLACNVSRAARQRSRKGKATMKDSKEKLSRLQRYSVSLLQLIFLWFMRNDIPESPRFEPARFSDAAARVLEPLRQLCSA